MYMYAYFLVMYVCVSCNDVVMLVDAYTAVCSWLNLHFL